jgi:hypothetical protein
MKKVYLIILFLAFLTCREKEQKYDLPIDKNRLKSLLIDLYTAGAASEMNPSGNKDSLKAIYHTEICRIYKLDSKQLAFIIDRLHALPKINGEVQKEVLDSMNAMQSPGFKFNAKPAIKHN